MKTNELKKGATYKIDDLTIVYRGAELGYQWTNYVFDVIAAAKQTYRVGQFYVLSSLDVERHLKEK